MNRKTPLPREQRSRFQAPPLPFGLRMVVLTVGWICILLGIAGLFLPILQGGLTLAIGFALLSIGSQWMHLQLRRLMGRWPKLWRRFEKMRRKMHRWLHRRSQKRPDRGAGSD